MIWVMFAGWAFTLCGWWAAEAQLKRWEQIANRHKNTAEMWEHMYQGERDHV